MAVGSFLTIWNATKVLPTNTLMYEADASLASVGAGAKETSSLQFSRAAVGGAHRAELRWESLQKQQSGRTRAPPLPAQPSDAFLRLSWARGWILPHGTSTEDNSDIPHPPSWPRPGFRSKIHRDLGSIPGWGSSPGGRHGNPLQYSCLGNPMDRGAWQATVYGVSKDLGMTEHTCFCFTCSLIFLVISSRIVIVFHISWHFWCHILALAGNFFFLLKNFKSWDKTQPAATLLFFPGHFSRCFGGCVCDHLLCKHKSHTAWQQHPEPHICFKTSPTHLIETIRRLAVCLCDG